MVTGGEGINPQEEADKTPLSSMSVVGGGTRSWGTPTSGQSVSTSGSLDSPSSRSDQVTAYPDDDSPSLQTKNHDVARDDAGLQGATCKTRRKRAQTVTGSDKNGRGLRLLTMKLCENVERKGRTTCSEVADALVAEFSFPLNDSTPPDQQQYDEKNIRRRVYDTLNVLLAMDILSKDKKEIQWRGLRRTTHDIEELKIEGLNLRNKIEKKATYLQELKEQYIGLQNLILRNHQPNASADSPTGGLALPFIIIQTSPHATIEVEISEDMQLVYFDFKSTPFELHDDSYVLKSMQLCERSEMDKPKRARVKNEHS